MSAGRILLRNCAAILPIGALATFGWIALNVLHVRPATRLPLTPVDRAIPFLTWTIFPYLLLLASDALLPLFVRTWETFRATLVAYVASTALNFAIWIAWPVAYVRPPLPAGDSLADSLYRLMVSIDGGVSCFPSGHVTVPFVMVWGLTRDWPRARVWLWTWFWLSAPTILTIKQHYAIDLLAGLATAAFGIAVARLVFRGAPEPAHA